MNTLCLSKLSDNYLLIKLTLKFYAEHAQDKQIQRDDEYYYGENDNDNNMDDGP